LCDCSAPAIQFGPWDEQPARRTTDNAIKLLDLTFIADFETKRWPLMFNCRRD
jgi:hypothetical protein